MLNFILDTSSIDALSHRGVNPSIGEVSLSMVSGSQTLRIGQETDRESASNIALAGASLAGSITSSCVPSGQRYVFSKWMYEKVRLII